MELCIATPPIFITCFNYLSKISSYNIYESYLSSVLFQWSIGDALRLKEILREVA